jgi:hypothetical protein
MPTKKKNNAATQPRFYLELVFRAYYGKEDSKKLLLDPINTELDRPDCVPVCLPVLYAWQEDADDLHIQLDTPDGRARINLCPETWDDGNGDYIVPCDAWLLRHLGKRYNPVVLKGCRWPSGKKHDGILVYHLGWIPEPRFDGVVAPKEYLRLLESCWYSPNR